MASFHNLVSNYTIIDERWTLTYNADSAIVAGDVGKMVEIDATAANKVKLVTDGGAVFGRIEQFEARPGGNVVTVARKGVFKVTKSASAVAVGDAIVGAGSGLVKSAPAVTPSDAVALTAAQVAALSARGRSVIVQDLGSNAIVVELI